MSISTTALTAHPRLPGAQVPPAEQNAASLREEYAAASRPPTSVHFVPLDVAHVTEAAQVTGLCITIYMAATAPGPVRASSPLSDHLAVARHAALAAGHPAELVDRVLAPAVRLAADMLGWTTSTPHQVLLLSADSARGFTLPHTVAPHVVVGESFRLHPLVATRAFRSSTQTVRRLLARPFAKVVASSSVVTSPSEIDAAAGEGRIAKLFVGVAMPVHTRDRAEAPSLADRAITSTLRTGGRVRFLPAGLGQYALAATLTEGSATAQHRATHQR